MHGTSDEPIAVCFANFSARACNTVAVFFNVPELPWIESSFEAARFVASYEISPIHCRFLRAERFYRSVVAGTLGAGDNFRRYRARLLINYVEWLMESCRLLQKLSPSPSFSEASGEHPTDAGESTLAYVYIYVRGLNPTLPGTTTSTLR